MQHFCYLRLLIFGDTPFGILLLQKVQHKIIIVHILFILVNTRFLTLLSLGLVTDIYKYGSIKDNWCEGLPTLRDIPIYISVPFRRAILYSVKRCRLIDYWSTFVPRSSVSRCKDTYFILYLYSFGSIFMVN